MKHTPPLTNVHCNAPLLAAMLVARLATREATIEAPVLGIRQASLSASLCTLEWPQALLFPTTHGLLPKCSLWFTLIGVPLFYIFIFEELVLTVSRVKDTFLPACLPHREATMIISRQVTKVWV